MIRVVFALLALLLLLAPATVRAEVRLQPSVTVTGNVIRLGDLFAGAGANANDVVAPAPALGTRATYSSAWLAAIAREHQLNWRPSSEFDQSTVERASRSLGADLIAQRLRKETAAATSDSDAQIQFDNPGLRLLVPAEASDAIDVEGFVLDPRTGRFSATISAPPGSADAQRQRVTGKLLVEVTIAVPIHNVAINEILHRDDIEQIKIPRDRLAADTLVDPTQLIGKSARRILRAEQPLRAGDVQEPLVVHKGDLVTIELRTAAMELSAQGKALEDGAAGVTIHVSNTQSNRTIDAIVTGPNLVRAAVPTNVAAR